MAKRSDCFGGIEHTVGRDTQIEHLDPPHLGISIENKAEFHAIRDSELEGTPDKFGQGPGGNSQPAPQAINPDYIMYGKALDMPNRTTDYFLLEFTIFNAQTRVQVWSRHYEVKVSR